MGKITVFTGSKDSIMIVIAGYGFVGKAHYEVFKDYRNLKIVDPKFNTDTIQDTPELRGVICCVPTPKHDDNRCDMKHVYSVVEATPDHVPILIKSTISLDGWNLLKESFPNHVLAFSPEFLKANNALADMKNLDSLIISGDSEYWIDQFSYVYPDIKIYRTTPEEAITIKYFRNAFLATKVSFFNHINDFCEANNINFDAVRRGVSIDKRIGESHTFVDPQARGWGGMCFPKDTAALLKMAADKNINLNTLEAAVEYNKTLRNNT